MTTNRNIFIDDKYIHYLAQYVGNPLEELKEYPDYEVNIINDSFLTLSVPVVLDEVLKKSTFNTIPYIQPSLLFTLQATSPTEASNSNFLQLELPLNLTGKGVIVVLIDTGVNYLSEEFVDKDGKTRIDYLWDQSIQNNGLQNSESSIKVPFGAIYSSKDIQEAINASSNGLDPYAIVPSKDTVGHGTEMAAIIGGSGKKTKNSGMVSDCRFFVIKLAEDIRLKQIYDITIPVYNISVIIFTLQFLYEFYIATTKPLIVYFPLGTTLGSHKGNSILERFIQNISANSLITLVSGTGNEKDAYSHSSGYLTKKTPINVVELKISPLQKALLCEVWVDIPNIATIDIISPSGENTGEINYIIDSTHIYNYVFEKTQVKVNYYIPENFSGAQLIRIKFFNLQPGIWKLKLIGKLILDGRYDIWLPPKGVIRPGTEFSPADPYGTITIPSASKSIVTAASYNQNNDNLLDFSGIAFRDDYVGVIDVAAGAINAITINSKDELVSISGSSVASAIVTGACAMIYQWAFVDGNYPNIYAQCVKTLLNRGVTERAGDQYPNPQWGYGILNVLKIFENIN